MSSPNQRSKDPKLIASAILIALIVIAAIVLVGIRLTGSDDNKTVPGPQTATGPKSSDSSSACDLPDGDQTVPTVGPRAVWSLSGKMAAPISRVFGPAKTNGGVHSCFAHNPTGALFAASNYLADTVNPRVDKNRLLKARILDDTNKPKTAATTDSSSPTFQISAYRFEDFTTDRTTVALVARATEGPNSGQNASISFTLAWHNGDWQIVAPASGIPPASAVASLSGFTPWSGA